MSTQSTPGRVAVITGASSGIGAATARALAADGYRLALLARRADRLQALAKEIGDISIAIEADVSDRDSLVAAAQRVQQELGRVDVLVNNAGVMLLGPFTSDQRDEQRRMVEVNLLGAMTATEVFLDQLRDGGDRHRARRRDHRTRRHITHGETKQATEQFYEGTSITADDIAQIIAFAVSPAAQRLDQRDPRPTHRPGLVRTRVRAPGAARADL
jgi:NADP-dependent 3-hydroxy acid dehydrogenase YdfG